MTKRLRAAHPADYYGVDDVLAVVTELYQLEGSRRGKEFDVVCPNPKHPDTSASCGVNSVTGYWHCFSCGVGGDIAELGALVLGRPVDDVEYLLSPRTPEALLTRVQHRIDKLRLPKARSPKVHIPDYTDTNRFDYLRKRLFTPATFERWGLRWIDEATLPGQKSVEYTIFNSIAIPIRDRDGKVLAWCYRRTDESADWQPKYLYTTGVELSELWYGHQHHYYADRVTVVEGALDAEWLDQCGFPALGLLGSHMGDKKILDLQRYRSVILLGDLDTAGHKWVTRVGEMVGRKMPLYVGQYSPYMMKKRLEPDGTRLRATDPEDLLPVDLEIVHERALTYASWRLQQAQRNSVG